MKLWSSSWVNGERIPARHAAGKPDAAGEATFSTNINPHLAWSEAIYAQVLAEATHSGTYTLNQRLIG